MVLSLGSPPSVPRRLSSRVPGQEERQPLPRSRGLREASVPSGKRWSGDRGFTLGASVIWCLRAYARLPPEPTSFPDTQGGASVSHAGISPQVLWGASLNGDRKTVCGGVSVCAGAVFGVFVIPPGPGVLYVSRVAGTAHCATAWPLRVQ